MSGCKISKPTPSNPSCPSAHLCGWVACCSSTCPSGSEDSSQSIGMACMTDAAPRGVSLSSCVSIRPSSLAMSIARKAGIKMRLAAVIFVAEIRPRCRTAVRDAGFARQPPSLADIEDGQTQGVLYGRFGGIKNIGNINTRPSQRDGKPRGNNIHNTPQHTRHDAPCGWRMLRPHRLGQGVQPSQAHHAPAHQEMRQPQRRIEWQHYAPTT